MLPFLPLPKMLFEWCFFFYNFAIFQSCCDSLHACFIMLYDHYRVVCYLMLYHVITLSCCMMWQSLQVVKLIYTVFLEIGLLFIVA